MVPWLAKRSASGSARIPAVVNSIQSGDEVRIDNSSYLALQTYHRHQVPTPDLYGWNQFRNGKGEPIYPQRKVLIGPIGALNGAGSVQNGRFKGKMIALESMMDIDALPWQADWYRTKVKEALGNRLDEEFRLYFIDHAQHTPPAGVPAQARTVSYQGALEQALRDRQCVGREGREASGQHQLQDGRQPGGGAGLGCAARAAFSPLFACRPTAASAPRLRLARLSPFLRSSTCRPTQARSSPQNGISRAAATTP